MPVMPISESLAGIKIIFCSRILFQTFFTQEGIKVEIKEEIVNFFFNGLYDFYEFSE